MISYDSAGKPGAAASQSPSISGDGAVIAFESLASLVPLDGTSGWPGDVYVRDRKAAETVFVSVNSAGTGSGDQNSSEPRINREGTTVVWSSYATNLDSNVIDANGTSDIFYRKWTAPGAKTDMLSRASTGTASANGYSSKPIISANGITTVFTSVGTNLTAYPDINNTDDLFFVRAAAVDVVPLDPSKMEGDSTSISYDFRIYRTWMTESGFQVKWKVIPSGASPVNADDFGGAFPEGSVSFSPGEPSTFDCGGKEWH